MSVAQRGSDEPLSPLDAYRALQEYGRQSGVVRLMLLAHCAVPEQVLPDLVNLIKVNFLPESGADLSVDADVLFSPILEPIGTDFYRMEPEIRRQCLSFLDAAYRWEEDRRTNQVARLVLRYLERLEAEPEARSDLVFAEFIDVQRWSAWAFLDPGRTAQEMEHALAPEAVSAGGMLFRLGALTAALSIPLAGHQQLLAYARRLDAIESGNIGVARELIEELDRQTSAVEDAKQRHLRALLAERAGTEPEDPAQAARLSERARQLQNRGDLAGARLLYERALAIAEKTLGPEHRDTGECLANLARLLQAQGDLAGARPLYERALAIAEKALPGYPENVADCLAGLARLRQEEGDLSGARSLYERAWAIITRASPEHIDWSMRRGQELRLSEALRDLAAAEVRARAEDEAERIRPRVFLSFFFNPLSGEWVRHARDLLGESFEIYDYRSDPVRGPNLRGAVSAQIAASDVFICLLSKAYYENETTRGEFIAAVERSTGSVTGSLAQQRYRPLVYVVAFDDWAENWLQMNHPNFFYLVAERYGFAPDGKGFSPVDLSAWDALRFNVEHRLSSVLAPPAPAPPVEFLAAAKFAVLGRPSGQFPPPIKSARSELLAELGEWCLDVDDGWRDLDPADPNTDALHEALHEVAAGSPLSVLIQPCDREIYRDNFIEGDLGTALRIGLPRAEFQPIAEGQARRIAVEEARSVLSRTLFWVPRVGNLSADPVEGPSRAPAISDIDTDKPGSGPWFGAATAHELALWIRKRREALRVVLDSDLIDIVPQLRTALQSYFPSMTLGLGRLTDFPEMIADAVRNGNSILIATSDTIGPAGTPVDQIFDKTRAIDDIIENRFGRGLRVARAVFLVRYADAILELSMFSKEKWVLVPLRQDKSYEPPPDRMRYLVDELRESRER